MARVYEVTKNNHVVGLFERKDPAFPYVIMIDGHIYETIDWLPDAIREYHDTVVNVCK